MAKRRPGLYSPEYTPPHNSFFIDDDDFLFVMTYEKGNGFDEYVYDIFNEKGIFIGRASLGLSGFLGRALNRSNAVIRNNRYYRIRFKEDDYVELIVYKVLKK